MDGNVIRFGSESEPDQPFGPWLDMRGDLWSRGEDDSWTMTRTE